MLHNKFVIGAVGVLFCIVAVCNVNFFLKKKAPVRYQNKTESSLPSVDYDRPRESLMISPFPVPRDKENWKRDPFRHARENGEAGKPAAGGKAKVTDIKLQGITVRDSKRFALVNGWVVEAGDRIDGVTIADITPYGIVVKDAGGVREINIYNDIRHKEK